MTGHRVWCAALLMVGASCVTGAEWRRTVVSDKGTWTDAASTHPLGYFTVNALLRDDANDLCVACTAAEKAGLTKRYAIRTKVKPVGVLAGYRIVDVFYHVGRREESIPKAAQWKSILVQVGADRFREIYHLQASHRANVDLRSSRIVESGDEPVLVTMDREGGQGGGYWEGYWWFDSQGPRPLDFAPLREAIRKQLPADVVMPGAYSWLSFEAREGRIWLRKSAARCWACDFAGALTVSFHLDGPRVMPVWVDFTPAPSAAAIEASPLSRVAALGEARRAEALRFHVTSEEDEEFWNLDALFYNEQRLRPALRALLRDAKLFPLVIESLSLIGDPSDLDLLMHALRAAGEDNRWAYAVACALVDPRTESAWSLLRRAALNKYDDRWVDAGAIQTLKAIASPRSRGILEEVRDRNKERANWATRAIEYIDGKPAPLVDRDLERLAGRVANAIRYGRLGWIGAPLFSRERDKVLVEFTYFGGGDRFTYHATFHRVDGVWRFRGARETEQAVLAPPPPSGLDLDQVPVRKAPALSIK